MPAPALPEDAVEREYRSLARKLHAARGFCFIVYFVDDGRAARQLRDRLADDLASRGRRAVVLAADAPESLVAATLAGIFDAARPGDRPVVWVEAFRDPGDAAWDAERRILLMRMNERRSRLEAELQAPLVLLLPGGAQREAASLAPDLWHVRLHSAPLAAAAAVAGPSAPPQTRPPTPTPTPTTDDPVPQTVAYWESIEAGADVGQPLFDGFKAVQAWSRAGQPARADALAERLVARARARVDARLPDDTLAARVELALALRERGTTRSKLGIVDGAIAALQESADLLRAAAGDPVVAGLLTMVQKSLGDALLDAGRPREAEAQFRDSLATLAAIGAAPDAKEAWAAAALRVRIGDAALAAGDVAAALEAYRQGIDAWRQLAASSGDDPALQRALATALTHSGNAEARAGRGERTLRAYAEATALLRTVLARSPDDEEAARQLAVDLMRSGMVQGFAGRFSDALAAYAEALAVSERLGQQGRDVGGLLSLLETELERLAPADPEEAKAARALLDAARAARK